MHPMLNIAVRAARNAGQVVVKAFSQPENIEAIQKGSHDFVTSVDREAEAAIIHTIKKSYPEHSIVAEESGEITGTNPDYQWIIDPLDGTTNLVKGIPHFAVSIALRVKGKTEQAVVYDPIRDELFTSTRGNGAQLNGYRIRVGKAKELEDMGAEVTAVDSGIRRMVDQLEARPGPAWLAFKADTGLGSGKPITGKLIYAVRSAVLRQKTDK